MANPTLSQAAQEQLLNIANTILGVPTLEARMRDALDFPEVAVWDLKEALEAAYLAGMVDHHRRPTT